MTGIRHRLCALLLAGALAATGAGCAGPPPTTSDDVALVLAPTQGASGLTQADLDAPLAALDREGDRLVAVVADGAPIVVVDLTLPELPGNSKDREEFLLQLRGDLRSVLLGQVARVPEVDLSEAIALAAESFRPDTRRNLTIFGSGLQTTGAFSMLDGNLYADPADLLAHAEGSGRNPDLQGVTVTMPKLGVVTDPQPLLTAAARTALTEFWAAYFGRTGNSDVRLVATSLVASPQTGVSVQVTPVPVERPIVLPPQDCRQLLGMATVGFAVGHAELLEPAATRALLEETHRSIGQCAGGYVVEGSASSEGDAAANAALSLARAETVASVLADVAGVDAADIRVVGWGEAWPCRVEDVDAQGVLLLQAASANRAVVVSRGEPHC